MTEESRERIIPDKMSIKGTSEKVIKTLSGVFDEHLAGAFEKGEFRHPRERGALIFCWILVILVVIISSTITFGMLFIYLGIAGIYLYVRRWLLTTNAEELNPVGEHAWLYDFVQRTSKLLGLAKVPPIYIPGDPNYSAYTTGLLKPYIVITSGIFSICNEEEIKAVVAHELGHIKFRHVFNLIFLQGGVQQGGVGAIITLPLWVIGKMLFIWGLFAEYTADRTALWVCRDRQYKWVGTDMHPLASSLLKISKGERFGGTTTWENVENTYKKYRWSPGAWIAQLFTNHPHIFRRAYHAKQFYESLPPPPGEWKARKVTGAEKNVDELQPLLDEGKVDEAIQLAGASIKTFLQTGNSDKALDVHKRFHETFPESSLEPGVQFAVCKQLQINGLYSDSTVAYRNLALCHREHPLAPKAILECALILGKHLNDYNNAMAAYKYFADNYPDNALLPMAKSRYAKLREKMKDNKV